MLQSKITPPPMVLIRLMLTILFHVPLVIPFSFKFYSFIVRRKGKGKERERNINPLPLAHACNGGPGLKPRHVPWLEIKPALFHFAEWCSANWAMPIRAHWWSWCTAGLEIIVLSDISGKSVFPRNLLKHDFTFKHYLKEINRIW